MHPIQLEFDNYTCTALLFDVPTAHEFYEHLPYEIDLTQWGSELYGSIGVTLAEHKCIENIPAGGIAYTARGNLVCIFFGQKPAWAVEHIGMIDQKDIEKLIADPAQKNLKITKAE